MSTIAVTLNPEAAAVGSTAVPELVQLAGTNFPVSGYAFTINQNEALYFKLGVELYGNSGNLTLAVHWFTRTGVTTGTVTWEAALAAITPGDAQAVDTKAFAATQNASTAPNSTAEGLTLTTITVSNLDSANAGDTIWLRVRRTDNSTNDDAVFTRAILSYSDGNSGTPGSGDVVGPVSATNTAIARYDGTTGKLIQNSAVSVDASGNLTGVGTINGAPTPKTVVVATVSSNFTSTTSTGNQTITGLSVSLPRSGTYAIDAMLATTISASTTMTWDFSASANFTSSNVWWRNQTTATGWTDGFQTANSTATASTARTVTTVLAVLMSGSITVSGACTLVLQGGHSSTQTFTVQAGSFLRAVEQ